MIYLNFISVTSLISVIFTLVLGVFLVSIHGKSKATFHLSLAFLFFCGLNFAYFVGYSVYSPFAAYHDWLTTLTAMISISHMIQFLLYFSGMSESKMPKRILIIHYVISIIMAIFWNITTLSRVVEFRADGQFWSFTAGRSEEIVSLVILVHILSIFGFGIWRTTSVAKDLKTKFIAFLIGFACLTIAPGVANALLMNKIITRVAYQFIYSLITTIGWFSVFIIYINTSTEKITFIARILTVSFTTFMLILILIGYNILDAVDDAYNEKQQNVMHVALHFNDYRPSDLEYIRKFSFDDRNSEMLFSKEEVVPDFTESENLYKGYRANKPGNKNHGTFLRQNELKTRNFMALLHYENKEGQLYEAGFNYLSYRKYLHSNSMNIVYLLLLVIIVLIIGLPFFMYGSVIKPVKVLIKGLKRATDGTYEEIPAIDSQDEIGYLSKSFNEMIVTIAQSKQKILDYTQNLEEMVKEKTDKLYKAQQELISAARRAGMADIASNVIHNVGNVLNSVVARTDNLKSLVDDIDSDGMSKANKLYEENKGNPDFYSDSNSKGPKLVEYYSILCNSVISIKSRFQDALKQLEHRVSVISEIIDTQQQYASGPSVKDKINLCAAISQMLTIQKESIAKYSIQIINDCNNALEIYGHDVKLLNILINLYTNAKDAVLSNDPQNRIITIKSELHENHAILKFIDNGIGIEKDLLTKIFQHGFTTKKDGHGFGLHSCANDLNEMNASISAESEGINKGATFTISFSREK